MADEKAAEEEERTEERTRPGLRSLASRILLGERDEEERSEEGRSEDRRTRELLISALATGDKAKTEIVRLVAREVRSYLEALELHKDLHYLLTNYSLEVHASFSLAPKGDASPKDSNKKGSSAAEES